MLKLKNGVDILSEVGGIQTIDEARKLFAEKLDAESLAKLEKIKTEEALLKIANALSLCQPDSVFVTPGSDADNARIRQLALEQGEERPLALKDHTIHYDLPEEQGRIVDRTFYIVNEGEDTSVLAKTMPRDEALAYVRENMSGIMRARR